MARVPPRIHGEFLKLGFVVSEITVSRYMPRRPADPDQLKRWIAFFQLQRCHCGDGFFRGSHRFA